MRTIKFRAWDRKEKKMRTVDDLHNLWTLNDHDGDAQTIPNVVVINQSYRGDDLQLVVDKDCDLMQYTGLKDKNGSEIYEGDIVEAKGGDYVHEWKGDVVYLLRMGSMFGAGFYVDAHNKHPDSQDYYVLHNTNHKSGNRCDVEVIGNIYENKELLK